MALYWMHGLRELSALYERPLVKTFKDFTLVAGLGRTGRSAVRWCVLNNIPCKVVDTRRDILKNSDFHDTYPAVPVLHPDDLQSYSDLPQAIIVSPGLEMSTSWVASFTARQVPAISDIDCFSEAVDGKPIWAVTGTNGKSTVVHQCAEIARAAGLKAIVIGNVGVPVLDALCDGNVRDADIIVLELSSFQLESIEVLKPTIACILNLTPDHLDRHGTLEHYASVKRRIYHKAEHCVYNLSDARTNCEHTIPQLAFSAKCSTDLTEHLSVTRDGTEHWLCCYQKKLFKLDVLPAQHHLENMCAAAAIATMAKLPISAIEAGLKNFKGLPHRCQIIANFNNIVFINDSKSTTPVSTQAALNAELAHQPKTCFLLLGGQSKGADFSGLRIEDNVKILLYGQDRALIQATLAAANCQKVSTFDDAVQLALSQAQAGDRVLLSPACASFDEFLNFEKRGERFAEIINASIVVA